MKLRHLLVITTLLAIVAVGCRGNADEQARDAAADVRAAAARAGDRLSDGWLTARVQARYFADDSIKARYIDVTTRDGVVTLKGYVENDDLRHRARQIAGSTDGVRQVDDQLMIGQTPREAGDRTQESGPTPTAGATDPADHQTPGTPAAGIDDAAITSLIQAKYFLDPGVKGRHVDVETTNGVVTLRGEVASDEERAAALLMARTTRGVQRVEDGLTVNASLAPARNTPQPSDSAIGTGGVRTEDETLASSVTTKLTESQVPGITVTARDGVVLLEGAVPNQAVRQRALSAARTTEGVMQVVDRLTVR